MRTIRDWGIAEAVRFVRFNDPGIIAMKNLFGYLLLCGVFACSVLPASAAENLPWQTSADEAFAQAKREHRFVILDLEAVWCHWCHVMEHETYGNADVRKALNANYVALKIDQDANPDFAARYGDWGWPATIVFASDGSEIVKRRGYIEPQQMVALLKAIVDDPSPGPSVGDKDSFAPSAASTLDADVRKKLVTDYVALYNHDNGGWGTGQRYLDAPSLELALEMAGEGDTASRVMARQTLDQNLNLFDPVWGGVYQYSVSEDWKSPHFEKIMSFQADDLRLYALAYAMWHEPKDRDAANSILDYLTGRLMSPDGAFYVSQDADLNADVDGHVFYALDDAARHELGAPRVDTHIYSRENGWAIAALCQVHDSLGDDRSLTIAKRSALWISNHRGINGGGFRHDEKDSAGPYLSDNLAMTQAFMSLYRSSGERIWLKKAQATLAFIQTHFQARDGGFVSAPAPKNAHGVFAAPARIVDENIAMARVANLAYRTTGDVRYRSMSEQAMHFLTSPTVLQSRSFLPGLILADRELTNEPIHIAVVGSKADPVAKTLHTVALAYPQSYMRVDWWDRSEGALPNPDVTYPTLAKAAAFACAGNSCSLPVFAPDRVAAAVDRLRSFSAAKP